MKATESAKPRVAETFIAAYYLAHFFTYLQQVSFAMDVHWRYVGIINPRNMAMLYGVIYMVVGIGILLRTAWARVAGTIISVIVLMALWWLFRPVHSWPTVIVSTFMNVAIICYFATLWLGERAASNPK